MAFPASWCRRTMPLRSPLRSGASISTPSCARSFVPALDFRTSAGSPRAVITDFGILRPRPGHGELTLAALFPGATVAEARAAVGWPLLVPDTMETVPLPSIHELRTLRELQARTAEAHRRPVALPVQE
mgnify:CR=1 FL=1